MVKNKYQDLNEIIEYNGKIEKLYNKLAELEIENKKNTKEYKNTVSYISLIIDITNRKFRDIDIDDEELIDYEEDIATINGINSPNSDLIIDLLELSENNKVRRMCQQIYYFSRKNHIAVIEPVFFDDEILDLDEDEILEIQKDAEELLNQTLEEEDELELLKDCLFSHTLMDYLLDYLDNETDEAIRAELIKVKYRLIYLIENLEVHFISNPDSYTKTICYQDLLRIKYNDDKDLFEQIYTEPLKDTLVTELDYLSSLDEEYYKDTKNHVRAILRTLYIKAGLSINYDITTSKYLKEYGDKLQKSITGETTSENVSAAFSLKDPLVVEKTDEKRIDLIAHN